MGVITVVTSGKGGVGKSTVAAGVGAALARRRRRVLLIDGDAGLSCLDLMLGVAEEKVFDIADVICGAAAPAQAIYQCPWQVVLFLLPAPAQVEDIASPEVMRHLVPALARYYDHVLVDCPAGLGRGFESAAATASRALVVSTPDPVCLRNSSKAGLALAQHGIAQTRLVVNRFSGAEFVRQNVFHNLDEAIDMAGIRLIAVIPQDFALAAAAANGQAPAPRGKGVMALERLAARLEGEQVPLASLSKF